MALYDRDYMREGPPRSFNGMVREITAFQVIFGINIAVFVMQYLFEVGRFYNPLTGRDSIPLGGVSLHELARGNVYTLFTYMFVHGGVAHFFLNMMLLWFAGRGVQQLFGSRHFALIYLLSGIAGAATEMTVNGLQGDTTTPLIGASAAVFGLLMALAVVMPEERITAFIYFVIPVRLRLWTLAKGLFIIQLVFGLAGVFFHILPEGMNVAYFAHLGGAAMGWFYARSLGYGGRPLTYASQWQPPQMRQQRKPAMARTHARPPAADLDADSEPLPGHRSQDPMVTLMEEVVNPLLDKISLHGKASLTAEEQRILEDASREVERHRQSRKR